MTNPIDTWPHMERPRERLLQRGAETLTDAELLAILFGFGFKQKNALDLARDLLNQFQSLRGVLTADDKQLQQCVGIGVAKFCQLKATAEIARRYLEDTVIKIPLNCKQQVRRFLLAKLRDYQQEVFACIFLDNKNQLIRFEVLFFGSIRSTTIYPREIAKRALTYNAANIIISNNHPSGIAKPSQADIQITQHIQQCLSLIDIVLLDHVIVGDNQTISLAEEGILLHT